MAEGSQRNSLLAFLASKMSASPENVATEALGYILKHSKRAREVLRHVATEAGVTAAGDLGYHTQAVDEAGNRRDLASIRQG